MCPITCLWPSRSLCTKERRLTGNGQAPLIIASGPQGRRLYGFAGVLARVQAVSSNSG